MQNNCNTADAITLETCNKWSGPSFHLTHSLGVSPAVARLPVCTASDFAAQEQLLRHWLLGLDPFRKEILRATVNTFDTCLTAICHLPDVASVSTGINRINPAPPPAVPCLLLFESISASDSPLENDLVPIMYRQQFLAVAIADQDSMRTLFAAADNQPVLLPFTLDLLERTVESS